MATRITRQEKKRQRVAEGSKLEESEKRKRKSLRNRTRGREAERLGLEREPLDVELPHPRFTVLVAKSKYFLIALFRNIL